MKKDISSKVTVEPSTKDKGRQTANNSPKSTNSTKIDKKTYE